MSKTNKELTTELTIAFIQSWNSKNNTAALNMSDAKTVFNEFKELIESMDESN